MELDLVVQEDINIVSIKDEIDFFQSAKFKAYFDTLLESKVRKIILNFQNVTYIDSSGIGALLTIFKKMKQLGVGVKFSNMHGSAKKVIELTKLNNYFPLCETQEEAIQALKYQ